jgi:hypothetical protein
VDPESIEVLEEAETAADLKTPEVAADEGESAGDAASEAEASVAESAASADEAEERAEA